MLFLDHATEKREYEERVRWLGQLYGSQTHSTQPRLAPRFVARLMNRMLFTLGSTLVWLGQRMQPQRRDIPAASTRF